jgi:hypothetical protein
VTHSANRARASPNRDRRPKLVSTWAFLSVDERFQSSKSYAGGMLPIGSNKEPLMKRVAAVAALVRDIGVVLGLPLLLGIGLKIYDLQTKAPVCDASLREEA